MQPLFGRADGGFNLFGALALLARRPVETAQAVENRSADLILGVSLEFHVLRRVETVDGRDQADDAGRNQIVQADALWQPVVNAARDQANLRQVLQDQLLALFRTERR